MRSAGSNRRTKGQEIIGFEPKSPDLLASVTFLLIFELDSFFRI